MPNTVGMLDDNFSSEEYRAISLKRPNFILLPIVIWTLSQCNMVIRWSCVSMMIGSSWKAQTVLHLFYFWRSTDLYPSECSEFGAGMYWDFYKISRLRHIYNKLSSVARRGEGGPNRPARHWDAEDLVREVRERGVDVGRDRRSANQKTLDSETRYLTKRRNVPLWL